jgi:hypothetical protein
MRKNEKLADIINEDDTEEKMKDRILSLAEENSSVEARDIFAALNSKVLVLECSDLCVLIFGVLSSYIQQRQ